jgi:SAM-dependent methyltransferase
MLGVGDLPGTAPLARRYPAPVSARRALAVIEMLRLPPAGRVLDLAAGTGGLLLDAMALNEGRGLGLVANEADAGLARAAAVREGLDARVEFRVVPPGEFAPTERFDAILLVQPTPSADGGPELAAARCRDWLRVGGVLLVGQPFLRRPPPPRYRALLGAAGQGLRTTGACAAAIVAAGFELLVTAVCSETEWDAHESASYRARLHYAAAFPDPRAASALRERAETWYHAYWRYGRDTLGFSFHAFRKPRGLAPVAVA